MATVYGNTFTYRTPFHKALRHVKGYVVMVSNSRNSKTLTLTYNNSITKIAFV